MIIIMATYYKNFLESVNAFRFANVFRSADEMLKGESFLALSLGYLLDTH
jgi:hypothetical protein